MLLRVEHETRLGYSEPVTEHVAELRMAPQSDDDQTALGYRLGLEPAGPVVPYRDGFGNRADLSTLAAPSRGAAIRAVTSVRPHRRPAAARLDAAPPPGDGPAAEDVIEFLQPSPLVGASSEVAEAPTSGLGCR